ncbi:MULTISPECIES: hypothetical protein [Empedobacter]|uniref:hypothetical protein n=1 Tax=Empedobacter TaxID=59734 RepID=UPI000F674EEF|nr:MULTISPECIES: hypothetical protein [Empedobacter]MDH0660436.1 hypothetical protein [Empedobacter sp. GD03865]MDH0673138.1 hypothetical protein [Empedobacter sp. GD03861]MDH2207917.1 hypothetical protein [Empedobacter sp. GD03644]
MSKILNSKVIIFVFLLIVFYLYFFKSDFTNGQNQTELDYSVNIIFNNNYKEDKVKSASFTIIGNNPETNKIDSFKDGRWFSNVSDSIEKGDTVFKMKGKDYFLIKKKNYILKINLEKNQQGKFIEVLKR